MALGKLYYCIYCYLLIILVHLKNPELSCPVFSIMQTRFFWIIECIGYLVRSIWIVQIEALDVTSTTKPPLRAPQSAPQPHSLYWSASIFTKVSSCWKNLHETQATKMKKLTCVRSKREQKEPGENSEFSFKSDKTHWKNHNTNNTTTNKNTTTIATNTTNNSNSNISQNTTNNKKNCYRTPWFKCSKQLCISQHSQDQQLAWNQNTQRCCCWCCCCCCCCLQSYQAKINQLVTWYIRVHQTCKNIDECTYVKKYIHESTYVYMYT